MRILDSQCCHCGRDVSFWFSSQDPHDLLSEETEEVVLAVLDDSPAGEVSIENRIVVLIDVVEADFTSSCGLRAYCLGRA